jgi:hypothetical protein
MFERGDRIRNYAISELLLYIIRIIKSYLALKMPGIFRGRASKGEVWRKFSGEIGAEFVKGGLLRSDKVVARVKEWTITLDTYTEGGEYGGPYTRMRAPYMSRDGFQFTIYRGGLLSKLGKHLGLQDVETGYPDFDREFILKSNDEAKVRALVANPRIRQLIQSHPAIYFRSKTKRGGSAHAFPSELYFRVPGVIEDVERLKSFFLLFTETLSQLCDIGSAYESDPRGAAMQERRRR